MGLFSKGTLAQIVVAVLIASLPVWHSSPFKNNPSTFGHPTFG